MTPEPRQSSAAEGGNPYAAPVSMSMAGEGFVTEFDEVRRKHLSHEASVQSIGMLYLLAAIFSLPVSVVVIYTQLTTQIRSPSMLTIGLLVLALSVLQLSLAYGLQRLRSWARPPAVLLSCLGLIGFPVGTLISIYLLYLLLSVKGGTVFSPEYAEVIRQTPHIHYRTPRLVLLLLVVLLGLLAIGIGAALLG